jgi:hypothetical protein
MRVQGCRRRENDEEPHPVRHGHANQRVEVDAVELGSRLLRRAQQRLLSWFGANLFDFLRGLPEEQVRADCGAEHGDDRCQIVTRELNRWFGNA